MGIELIDREKLLEHILSKIKVDILEITKKRIDVALERKAKREAHATLPD